jgi:hypothetical protein
MPGLLRGVARTAVIAGTATGVSNRVSRRQGARWAQKDDAAADQQEQQQPQPAPPPPQYAQPQYAQPQYAPPPPQYAEPPVDTDKTIEQLKQLGELHAQGILTDEEFSAQKATIIGS